MSPESPVRDRDAAGFDLIETMRWEPVQGFIRFERHLARLYRSAHELGFAYDPEAIGRTLNEAIGEARAPLRARLVLSPNGDAAASTQPYEPLPPHKVWRLKIARTRLDSSDPLIAHKTSRRETYMKARAEYPVHQADEVILLNERNEVCEGTFTNVFVDTGDDVLLTPAIGSGLLPGVLRAELLAEGRAREAVIGRSDLIEASSLLIGNSLRGLIQARLDQ
jgi:4-amino-4-deoxychorismate lyase